MGLIVDRASVFNRSTNTHTQSSAHIITEKSNRYNLLHRSPLFFFFFAMRNENDSKPVKKKDVALRYIAHMIITSFAPPRTRAHT